MSENWNTKMSEALRLTRAGQLAQATSLLQHGLAGLGGTAGRPQPEAAGAEDLAGRGRRSPVPTKRRRRRPSTSELHRATGAECSV